MKAISQFLLASMAMGGLSDFDSHVKASDRTLSRKRERNITGSRKMYEGEGGKVSQKLVDTKDKFDKPTGVMVVNERKTQRNDKCPCGSGKKFKHCHLV